MTSKFRSVFDTNVISALADCSDHTLLPQLLQKSGTVFVPYFVKQELERGVPRNEMRYLAEIGAEHEPSLTSSQLTAISAIEEMQVAVCRLLIFGESEGASYEENLNKHGFGPKHLNNLRPPRVVESILQRLDMLQDGKEICAFFTRNSQELDFCDLITLQSLLLSLLGFWRDALILKSKPDLSKKDMMKQYQDAKLIGVAGKFDRLVSSDRRLCSIAHAVYEFNLIGTKVLFLERADNREVLEVSAESWPRLTRQKASARISP